MKTKLITMAVLGAVLVMSATVPAAVIMNVTEVGSDVFAAASGTVNTTGLTFVNTTGNNSKVYPVLGILLIGSAGVDYYTGVTGPSNFGSAYILTNATSYTGGIFGIAMNVGYLDVPNNYVSGSQINSSSTWAGASFSSLGLAQGTYIYTWGSGADADSLTINIGAVPEPATMALLGLGGLLIRRRKA